MSDCIFNKGYEITFKSKDLLIMEIEVVLDQIGIALGNNEIPVLKVVKRNSDSAISYTTDAVILSGELKVMDLVYGSDRFEIYTSILKDILEGLEMGVTSKKR